MPLSHLVLRETTAIRARVGRSYLTTFSSNLCEISHNAARGRRGWEAGHFHADGGHFDPTLPLMQSADPVSLERRLLLLLLFKPTGTNRRQEN